MVKIAVLTDIHANLPALDAALSAIQQEGCDAIYHIGDVIGIGPYPAECLDKLLALPSIYFIMGNHDAWFINGIPQQTQPEWIRDSEKWTHRQLDDVLRIVVAQWPYVLHQEFAGVSVTFMHYGLQSGSPLFVPINRHPSPADLDEMFAHHRREVVFYGHDHIASDLTGQARYINPGSLGCSATAVARYVILECAEGRYTITPHAVPYDDTPLFNAYVKRQVPEGKLISRVFHGNRRPLPEV